VNKQFRTLGDIVYIGDVAELRRIEVVDGRLHIGAGASLENAWKALVSRWPPLQDMWLRFGSLPVRNAGTMGGNVANGSPIGDSAPVLLALDASLQLRCGAATRMLPLDDFYVDYMKNCLQPSEFVQAIVVPLREQALRAYKISKRYDCDISALSAGLSIEFDGPIVRSARFAYGGMAATVARARHAERAVIGQPWTEATVQAAMAALKSDFTPLTDHRASAGYRHEVAARLLQRYWLETRAEAPMAADALSVWRAS
jgi:xanthine dehydrogenase small subunit